MVQAREFRRARRQQYVGDKFGRLRCGCIELLGHENEAPCIKNMMHVLTKDEDVFFVIDRCTSRVAGSTYNRLVVSLVGLAIHSYVQERE